MKNIFFLMLLTGITALFSCKGDMGDVGPAGKDGIDGVDGTDGINGQNGQNGNANVKSFQTAVAATDWQVYDSHLSLIDLQVPTVTQQIAATGLVMVYFQFGGGEWYALPYSRSTQNYFFWAKTGLVRLHTQNDNTSPEKFSGNVRVVAVSADGLARNPDLDWGNFIEVKKRLELAD